MNQVLEALRKRSPQAPSDLANAAGLSKFNMRKAVKVLVKRGIVETSGATMSRQISLSRQGVTKESL